MKRASNQCAWLVLILLLVASCGCSREEPGVEIPLNKIWAWDMPGTEDIRTLEPKHFGPAVRPLPAQEQIDLLLSSLVQQIRQFIQKGTYETTSAGPGFAVAGSDRVALDNVYDILVNSRKPLDKFSSGTSVTAFFYSRLTNGRYFHIKRCERKGSTITVKYQLVPYNHRMMTLHFALIPLGKLEPGKYSVQFVSIPEARYYRSRRVMPMSKEVREKLVCKAFDFSVIADAECKSSISNEQENLAAGVRQ